MKITIQINSKITSLLENFTVTLSGQWLAENSLTAQDFKSLVEKKLKNSKDFEIHVCRGLAGFTMFGITRSAP